MATIAVYYAPIVVAGTTLPFYHEFIVYTPDGGGDPQYLRGGNSAGTDGFGLDSGGGSGSSGSTSSPEGPNFPFGSVEIVNGDMNSPTAPNYTNLDGSSWTSDQYQVVATGSNATLGAQFAAMTSYMESTYNPGGAYGSQGIAYGPTGPNSNSVVSAALKYVGIALPTGTGLTGQYAAPGANVPLAPASFGTELANDLGVIGVLVVDGLQAIENDIVNGVESVVSSITQYVNGAVASIFGAANAATETDYGNASANGITVSSSGSATIYSFAFNGGTESDTISSNGTLESTFYTSTPVVGGDSYNIFSGSGATYNTANFGPNINDFSNGGNTLDTGSSGNYDFSGVNDTVNNFLNSTSGNLLLSGNNDTFNFYGSSTAAVAGTGDDVNGDSGDDDTLSLGYGGGDFDNVLGLHPSGAIITGLSNNLSSTTIYSNSTATFNGAGQSTTISGTNITATGVDSANIQTTSSSQAVISGSNAIVVLGAGSNLTVNGSGSTTSIAGSNATLTQDGGGTVHVGPYITGAVIYGNNLTIFQNRNSSVAVYGNNDTIVIPGGPNSLVADAATSKAPTAAEAFVSSGTGNTISYDASGYGSYGGYGFSEAPPTSGTNIGVIASYDAQLGNQSGANTALSAQLQAQSSLASPSTGDTNTPEFEGAKWASKTITWSLATTYDLVGAQLSGLISSQYVPLIQQAFHDWSVLSGLQFKQVAASASPDIELGWSTFNPSVTGVLGYTGFSVINGAIQSGALISLENPADDALAKDATGQLAYTGTQTELEQLILHEIGHALGLADDSDPKSIMYAVLSSKNRFFDATDMAGIQDLYDSPSVSSPASTTVASDATALSSSSPITVASSLVSSLTPSALTPFASEADQLINAMAVFNPSASPTAYTPLTLASVASSMTLAASGH